jgi:hypothetical protein
MPQHDLTTFYGRFKYYMEMTSPSTLIYSDADVMKAKSYVDAHPISKLSSPIPNEEYEKNKRLVDAAIHPSSGEIILKPFRVSSIALVNIPIILAMITVPASNVPVTMFLHWFNQSYNTACNYSNRSSSSVPWDQTMIAYGGAVSSAMGVAYLLGRLAARGPASLRSGKFGFIIPMIASAAAGSANISFTRSDELMGGAPVRDEDNVVRGVSRTAGFQGVAQTALTRCVMIPISCLMLPSVMMAGFKAAPFISQTIRSNKRVLLVAEVASIYGCFAALLPAALAVYPQTIEYTPAELEPQFHNLMDAKGQPVTRLFGSKCL